MNRLRGLRPICLLLLVAGLYLHNEGFMFQGEPEIPSSSPEQPARSTDGYDVLGEAFRAGRSDILVAGEGRVEKVLRDDDKGSRHQRFLLALDSGQTVLIAHNIDLAPRIPDLRRGDVVQFKGEYEWNERGGVVHWTHHDPAGRHEGGWLEHDGSRYD